jgi:tryptophan 2,3-dioxygenase
MLFIVVHQVYELWFKLLLHELARVKEAFSKTELSTALATFKRLNAVMHIAVEQLDTLATMTPVSFNRFRSVLETASGFQSVQFRSLELQLGQRHCQMAELHRCHDKEYATLQGLEERSVIDHFYDFLSHYGVEIPKDLRSQAGRQSSVPNDRVQEGIAQLYRSNSEVIVLFEAMLDFDELLQEWRYKHFKLAERTIGAKAGTAGLACSTYLKQSLFRPVFADLWDVRHKL